MDADSLTDSSGSTPSRTHGTALHYPAPPGGRRLELREFCIGNDVGPTYVWDRVALEDLASINGFSADEDARLLAYVRSLDDASLAEPLALSDGMSVPRWLIVAHVVNHGTQHRSELARFLTDRGHSPCELDLLDAYAL